MGVSNAITYDFQMSELIQQYPGLSELSEPFSHEKIDRAIKLIPADRAPGPSGFDGQFLKVCWEIITEDFYNPCHDF